MATKSTGKNEKRPGNEYEHYANRELVIVSKQDAGLRATPEGVTSVKGYSLENVNKILKKHNCSINPLFGLSEERIQRKVQEVAGPSTESIPDLSTYYNVEAPDADLEKILKDLQGLDVLDGAYIKPISLPAVETIEVKDEVIEEHLNDMQPSPEEAPPATPNFVSRQGYLNIAPGGIDAYYAWTMPGGLGNNIKIIDCEWGWNFTHEDLLQNHMGVVAGTSTTALAFQNHGTAVIGEIGGDRNTIGVTGICPNAVVGASSFVNKPSAQAIKDAADKLNKGDILLLEIHRAGPNANGVGQFGFIAIEWWPDDFAAIRYAVNKGIIVVEAAGNGFQNLDDAVYNAKPTGFPANWKNPFNPANPSSYAVVVGAGAPPPGTHGRNHGPDRSRLGFSNYGRRVDCQGWGREVTTTGYGDLQGGINRNLWYTDTFSGTSSASPIVTGALGCVQGVLKAQGAEPLTPQKAIQLLRSTGSPQQDAPTRPATQRIGNRPNLRQLIPAAANQWLTNKQVIRTHTKYHSKMAWAIVDGSGWLRIAPTTTDGVTNILVTLNEALANNRKVDIYVYNGEIQQVTLK